MEPDYQRDSERRAWVRKHLGGADPLIERASEDASFRSYWRITSAADSYILMDAPPQREDSAPFVRIAAKLRQAGLHAPEIFRVDLDAGFLLLEDLGTTLYSARLNDASAPALYGDALDALLPMQALAHDDLPRYDEVLLRIEMDLFRDWLLVRHLGLEPAEPFASNWESLKQALVANALEQPLVFVHRDYHCRNLLVCTENNPGIIDFQDAVGGPLTYDLVSLLRDCYVRWPVERVGAWAEAYRLRARAADLTDASAATWSRWFDLMGLQRHLKAAGIFCRLCHRDGKRGYLQDIPRTLAYARAVCAADPRFHWLAKLLDSIASPLAERAG